MSLMAQTQRSAGRAAFMVFASVLALAVLLVTACAGVDIADHDAFPDVSFQSFADDSGVKYPQAVDTIIEAPWSDVDWSTPEKVKRSDGDCATASMGAGDYTYAMRAVDFDLYIPDSATVDGIKVEIARRSSGGQPPRVRDALVQLTKDGATRLGDNKADTETDWVPGTQTIVYGGPGDLWGEAWTASDINASSFGVDFSVRNHHGKLGYTASVDFIRITVYYTPLAVHELSISSTAGGSVTLPGEGTFTYDNGTVVELVAEADEHCRFVNWTGDTDEIGNINSATTTITMTGAYSITGNFVRELEITAASDDRVYDGASLSNAGYAITGGTLAAGDSLESVTVTGSQTEVGSSDNVASDAVIMENATDVTDNYDITYENGTLTVTAREITVTAYDDSKVYGETHTFEHDEYEITGGSLAPGHTLSLVLSSDGVAADAAVGGYAIEISDVVIMDNGTDVTANYDITLVKGMLSVSQRPLEIMAASDSKVYDGTPLTNAGYNITAGSPADGHTLISVNVTGCQTEVGSVANLMSDAVIQGSGNNVTANYGIAYVAGILTVTARELEITAASDSKVYDGTPLTSAGYSITAGLPADGHILVSVNVAGAQTGVGSSDNVASDAVIMDGSTNVTAQYSITYLAGTLEVTTGVTEGQGQSPTDALPLTQCFIATAAYGTPSAEEINVLRDFRDVVLMESTAGSRFVAWYYRTSPPIAEFIAGNKVLRAVVREFFVDPLVRIIESAWPMWRRS